MFDDATGALLGLNLCMFGEEKLLMRGGNPMEYSDLAEKCAAVYAEQLGGIQLLQLKILGWMKRSTYGTSSLPMKMIRRFG